MKDSSKNFLIGLFVLASLSAFVWILLYLRPMVGDQGNTLRVRFNNIDKVTEGTRVTFAGQPVGEVVQISEVQDAREHPQDGKVYIYELTLKVDSSIDVFTTDEIAVRTSGLLGERSVAISPTSTKTGTPSEKVTPDMIIYSVSTGSVEEAFGEISRLSSKAETVLDQLNEALDTWKKEGVWNDAADAVQSFKEVADALNQPGKIKEVIENVHSFSTALNETGTKMSDSWKRIDTAVEDVITVSKNLVKTSDSVNEIVNHVKEGKGSIGRMLMRDDFYLQVKALMNKVEIVMDDINHFGILFHLDKKWQRMRARRANLLQSLCTPMQFRNYFNDEIDDISTSLSRVGWVLDTSIGEGCMTDAVYSCEFQRVFADFMRRVGSLEDTLKLYNTQLMEQQCCDEMIPCECE
jgi:ABC-type transport system involved in resistance to organic solvents, periplasmic component